MKLARLLRCLPAAARAAPRAPAALRPAAARRCLSTEADREKRNAMAKRELAILAQAFQRYDGDSSGSLDKGEIERALADLDIPNDEIFVESLFSQLDKNKDGTIEIAEWLDNLPRGTRIRIVSRFGAGTGSALDEYRAVRLEVPTASVVYTYTDEAPMLATHSLLPVLKALVQAASGVPIELRDISLAGRILANFPERLAEAQRVPDELAKLGELAKSPAANIIKLPNISASQPQLQAAIAELRGKGYDVPVFPNDDAAIMQRYAKVLGSAVNPVLREGNSDRRVAGPVKAYAQANPHSMGAWAADSKSHVAFMKEGDFFGSEISYTMPDVVGNSKDAGVVRIEFVSADGAVEVLKAKTQLQPGEIIDASRMSVKALKEFYVREIDDAKAQGVLFSLHLKATMMKVSDPIMFGHAVKAYYRDTFATHAATFAKIGVDASNGLGDVYAKLDRVDDAAERDAIKASLEKCLTMCDESRPPLAMVDSDRGVTNLHVPSDIIIDASVPAAIRESGKMWAPDGSLHDAKFVIPDRCYATSYAEVFDHCRKNGAFDPKTMGCVSNVGLMAQKAEEYGSHDKTFESKGKGSIRVVLKTSGETLLEHAVEEGDIWRMCQTKDSPIVDWVKLGVSRARATGDRAIFWLDAERAHDAHLIAKVQKYLPDHDTAGLDISIVAPQDAMRETLQRCTDGKNTVSITGNVLRDYLTDLFPILELGTSAKMLSIVPLLAGGGLFETGAGGSAPKHIQQLQTHNHLRWDSLGEFLALAVSLEDVANKTNNKRAAICAKALDTATSKVLTQGKSPGRRPKTLDNRGSHFYLALYWAEALAAQADDAKLAEKYAPVHAALLANEATILAEIAVGAGSPVDIGGYFKVDAKKADAVMRPSKTFNAIIDAVAADADVAYHQIDLDELKKQKA
ncbi:monomeric type isocitrate dehydrogenase, NADP-dependent [Pelagophyceae sp. CCMP2097]|nr:monomeric type isocitrate dehydrogenase, NADP-dependent [Pelagophyceae sp. CCMP2097]